MTRKHQRTVDHPSSTFERPRRSRRDVADQFRQFYGELSDEDLDMLEYEEEFELFERVPSRKVKPGQ